MVIEVVDERYNVCIELIYQLYILSVAKQRSMSSHMKLDKGGGETKAEDCHKVNLGTMKGPIKGPEGNHNPHNNGGTFT